MPQYQSFLAAIHTMVLFAILMPATAMQVAANDPQSATLDTFKRQQLSDVYFSEGASAGDINGDDVADVVYGPYWFEGPDFAAKHEIYPAVPQNRKGYADNFFSWIHDFDGDGANDILTVGFPGKPGYVYRNPGKDGLDDLWERFEVIDSVSNESPQFTDLNGDGVAELVCSRHGAYIYATPGEDPFQPWKITAISGKVAPVPFGHGLGVGDVNGDGQQDVLVRNGWFEQPKKLAAQPAAPGLEQWHFHEFNFGAAPSDMFAYDLDGDGDNDVITALSAHNFGLVWYENTQTLSNGDVKFQQHVIMGDKPEDNTYGLVFSEPHSVKLADINADGLQDIVTGKTYWSHHTKSPMWDAGAVVYWFELRRSKDGEVEFVPHKADGESGIGRGLFVGDINNDDLPDIVTGGMKGAHVLTHSRRTVSKEEYELAQPQRHKELAAGLSPEEAAKNMTVPAGFKVQLAAGEPMVHQPVAMCVDAKGRLWVAEAHTYPQRAAEGEGKDKIMIFEDTDLDGVFDKSKTFIEGLNLVSGLEVGFGGVYVGAAPYLMFIPDRDGDDVPDKVAADNGVASGRQHVQFPKDVPPGAIVLRDGFGWHDTHETLNAFIWGPDGWLYGCHGVFTHSKVGKPGTPDDQRTGLNAGVWRYHPTKDEFEVFAHGTSNPWGVDFNDHGQAFISACVIPHLWHMVQGGRYHRQGGQHFNPHTYDDIKTIADHAHFTGNIRDHAWWGHEPGINASVDQAGGGHAHAGAMIYRGDNWPDSYRNQMFFNNIHGNRINCDILHRKGSGYVGSHGKDLMKANDQWFRGINLRYGPDGSVYLIDWYDKNACHRNNPEIWDRSNGRIYRISYGESKPQKVNLEALESLELVEYLFHKNAWYSTMARKILQHRGGNEQLWDAIEGGMRASDASDDSFYGTATFLQGLWAMHVTGGLSDENEFAESFLDSTREYVAAWSIQLEMEDRHVTPKTLKEFEHLARKTDSAVVRMYLASALQRLPLSQRWTLAENLAAHGEDAGDHNIPLLLWYGVEPLVPTDAKRAMKLALKSNIPLLRQYVVRRASSQNDTVGAVVARLATSKDPDLIKLILDEMLASFEGRVDVPMPDAWKPAFSSLSSNAPGDAATQQEITDKANQLAVIFGDQRIYPLMRNLLADADQDIKRRRQALDVLVRGQDKAASDVLLSDAVLKNEQLQAAAVKALSTVGNDGVPSRLLTNYKSFGESTRNDVVSTLVSRPNWTSELLNAIGNKTVPASDLHAYHVRQILAFKNDSINGLLKKHWGEIRETSADRKQQIATWKQQLTPDTLKKAHLGNGRRVFKKTCQNCHKLFGTGGDIGPDITGSNRANLDYILENVLDPSAVVGRSYQMTTVVLQSGQLVSGLLKQETDSALTIQTINDKVVVPKSQIDERSLSDVSMMPERQLDALSKDDARDLIAYLASPAQVALSGPPAPIDSETGKVPGAIEGENMKVVEKTNGSTRNQKMGGFTADRWSGNDQIWWNGGKPGDRLALELPVPDDGTYTIEIVFTKARDYGTIKLSIDDAVLEESLDLFDAKQVVTTGVLSYSGVKLSRGDHRLNVELIGANPKAVKSYMVGIDFVRLTQDN